LHYQTIYPYINDYQTLNHLYISIIKQLSPHIQINNHNQLSSNQHHKETISFHTTQVTNRRQFTNHDNQHIIHQSNVDSFLFYHVNMNTDLSGENGCISTVVENALMIGNDFQCGGETSSAVERKVPAGLLVVTPTLNVSRKFSMCIIFSTGYINI